MLLILSIHTLEGEINSSCFEDVAPENEFSPLSVKKAHLGPFPPRSIDMELHWNATNQALFPLLKGEGDRIWRLKKKKKENLTRLLFMTISSCTSRPPCRDRSVLFRPFVVLPVMLADIKSFNLTLIFRKLLRGKSGEWGGCSGLVWPSNSFIFSVRSSSTWYHGQASFHWMFPLRQRRTWKPH